MRKCRRGRRRSQGAPPLERDLGRVNASSPWSSWKVGVGVGETTRELRAGMPADQLGVPFEQDLGRANAFPPSRVGMGEGQWWWAPPEEGGFA